MSKFAENNLTGRFNTPLSKPVRVHFTFYFFEVKVYTYFGIVRKIQVTGSWPDKVKRLRQCQCLGIARKLQKYYFRWLKIYAKWVVNPLWLFRSGSSSIIHFVHTIIYNIYNNRIYNKSFLREKKNHYQKLLKV